VLTYAQAALADLKGMLLEATREQERAKSDKASIVVYGFSEEGNDCPTV
jgi:hypothetical protein